MVRLSLATAIVGSLLLEPALATATAPFATAALQTGGCITAALPADQCDKLALGSIAGRLRGIVPRPDSPDSPPPADPRSVSTVLLYAVRNAQRAFKLLDGASLSASEKDLVELCLSLRKALEITGIGGDDGPEAMHRQSAAWSHAVNFFKTKSVNALLLKAQAAEGDPKAVNRVLSLQPGIGFAFKAESDPVKDINASVVLSNGITMPVVAFGTGSCQPHCVRNIKAALAAGYRHLDTAEGYENEKEVGTAMAESGVPRSEIFLATKLSEPAHYADVRGTFKKQLALLQTDYVDLYCALHSMRCELYPAHSTVHTQHTAHCTCGTMTRHYDPA